METLEWIGAHAWNVFWLPVVLWSVPAAVVWLVAGSVKLCPRHRLDLVMATLLALPLSFVAIHIPGGWFGQELVTTSASQGDPVLFGTVLPLVDAAAGVEWRFAGLWWSVLAFATLIAGFGLMVGVARLTRSVRYAANLRRSATIVTAGPLIDALQEAKARVSLSRSVILCLSKEVPSPVCTGSFRPAIILPDALDPEIHLVLLHELQHVKRMDMVRAWIGAILAAVFSFHPLVHGLRSRLNALIEINCDLDVMSLGGVSRHAYANLLVRYATGNVNDDLALSLATSPSELKNRIHAMKSHSRSLVSLPVGLLIGVVVLLSVSLVTKFLETPVPPSGDGVQDSVVSSDAAEPYEVAEGMPELIGGLDGLMARIEYPSIAKRAGVEGRVVAQVVVDADGRPQDVRLLRGIGAGADEEAVRVIKESRFTPGHHGGRAVTVKTVITVPFRLSDTDTYVAPPSLQLGVSPSRYELDGEAVELGRLRSIVRQRVQMGPTNVTLTVDPGVQVGQYFDLLSILVSEGVIGIRYNVEGASDEFTRLVLPPA